MDKGVFTLELTEREKTALQELLCAIYSNETIYTSLYLRLMEGNVRSNKIRSPNSFVIK